MQQKSAPVVSVEETWKDQLAFSAPVYWCITSASDVTPSLLLIASFSPNGITGLGKPLWGDSSALLQCVAQSKKSRFYEPSMWGRLARIVFFRCHQVSAGFSGSTLSHARRFEKRQSRKEGQIRNLIQSSKMHKLWAGVRRRDQRPQPKQAAEVGRVLSTHSWLHKTQI